jgi:DNA-binding GntR family transcriptional regulator
MAGALNHRTLSAALIAEIREAILSGRYVAGAQLRQEEIAEAYGVSRIPVREALFHLESEGLVTIKPQKGAVVSQLSLAEVTDVLELRGLLEPRLLRASAPRLTAGDFAELDDTQARYCRAIAGGEVDRYGKLNAELHMTLYRRADMPRTEQMVASLLQTSDRYTRLQLSHEQAQQRAMREHGELIGLCRDGSFADAEVLLVAHIGTVQADLESVLTRDEASAAPPAG